MLNDVVLLAFPENFPCLGNDEAESSILYSSTKNIPPLLQSHIVNMVL